MLGKNIDFKFYYYFKMIVYAQLGNWRIVGLESTYSDVLAFQFNRGTDENPDWNQMGFPFIIQKYHDPEMDSIYSVALIGGISTVRFDDNSDYFRVRGRGDNIEFCNVITKDWSFSTDCVYTADLELFHRSDLANITTEDVSEANLKIITAIARHANNKVYNFAVVRFPTYMSILAIPPGYNYRSNNANSGSNNNNSGNNNANSDSDSE